MSYIILSVATFLLFLFLSPLTTTSTSTSVLDIDGNPLRPNSNYYILRAILGRGGGLTLAPLNSTQLCPLYVAQAAAEVSNGLPIRFVPVNPKSKTISLSTDLNFVFDAFTICVQSTVWSFSSPYIGIGGVVGNPGSQTISNWFKIQKAESGKHDYKIVFCPTVCEFCRVQCREIGFVAQKDGRRLLGLSDQPLLVNFKESFEDVGILQDA